MLARSHWQEFTQTFLLAQYVIQEDLNSSEHWRRFKMNKDGDTKGEALHFNCISF